MRAYTFRRRPPPLRQGRCPGGLIYPPLFASTFPTTLRRPLRRAFRAICRFFQMLQVKQYFVRHTFKESLIYVGGGVHSRGETENCRSGIYVHMRICRPGKVGENEQIRRLVTHFSVKFGVDVCARFPHPVYTQSVQRSSLYRLSTAPPVNDSA